MAISQAAGTEIIRSVLHSSVDNTPNAQLIIGEQHHIYTVLSITLYCEAVDGTTANNRWGCDLVGFSSLGGDTAQNIRIFQTPELLLGETYVWNDKFSFNGFEPTLTGYAAGMTTAAEQTLNAGQASSVSQYLFIWGGSATCKADITCTFIDQNNS